MKKRQCTDELVLEISRLRWHQKALPGWRYVGGWFVVMEVLLMVDKIEIPDTNDPNELEKFILELHRAHYEALVRLQELKPPYPIPVHEDRPPDLGIHVTDGFSMSDKLTR